MRFLAVLTYLLLAPIANAAAVCEISSILGCSNTNELLWAKSFEPALRGFLDKRKVSWLGQKQGISDAVEEVLGGAPDDAKEVAPGIFRFSAVRPHSATERGAIFISKEGDIEAIGVLHFNCAKQCDKTYSLSMVVKKEDDALTSLVQAWGKEQMHLNEQNGLEDGLTSIGRVELLTIKR
ncbi:hypothetical protein LJR030_003182 [Rhizobium sp. LjRoot30]|uniref:hypothetical protein n=1 Tax=Rhizobium sp. LjRoot30 TaxID=3342320 RepID=UPI003ECDFFA8